jgi:hypothetical protein
MQRGDSPHDEERGVDESKLGSWILANLEGGQGHAQKMFERHTARDEDFILPLLYDNRALLWVSGY